MQKLNTVDGLVNFIIWLLRVNIVLAAVYTLVTGSWELFFVSILALLLSFLPSLIEGRYKLDLPVEFEVVIVLFIYMSIFLGEYGGAYEKFFWWDALLHMASGIFFAFAAFIYLYALLLNKKLKASPTIIAIIAFSVSMGIGSLWEIFEYLMDSVFGLNMQKSGLTDTMWDLIVNAIGALMVSYLGFRMLTSNKENGVIYRSLKRFYEGNPHLKKGKHFGK